MATGVYLGAGGVKELVDCYVGAGGVRTVNEIYVGVGGEPKLVWARVREAIFTSSTVWTVPSGVRSIDIFCAGASGGAGGEYMLSIYSYNSSAGTYYQKDDSTSGSDGGGGYTKTQSNISVTPGQQITITVGAKGASGDGDYRNLNGGITCTNSTNGTAGGASSAAISGGTTVTANGGSGGRVGSQSSRYSNGVNGGSGSGCGGSNRYTHNHDGSYSGPTTYYDGSNGSDGSNGERAYLFGASGNVVYFGTAGKGQGTTTKAFGESDGTLYGSCGGSGVVIIRW